MCVCVWTGILENGHVESEQKKRNRLEPESRSNKEEKKENM